MEQGWLDSPLPENVWLCLGSDVWDRIVRNVFKSKFIKWQRGSWLPIALVCKLFHRLVYIQSCIEWDCAIARLKTEYDLCHSWYWVPNRDTDVLGIPLVRFNASDKTPNVRCTATKKQYGHVTCDGSIVGSSWGDMGVPIVGHSFPSLLIVQRSRDDDEDTYMTYNHMEIVLYHPHIISTQNMTNLWDKWCTRHWINQSKQDHYEDATRLLCNVTNLWNQDNDIDLRLAMRVHHIYQYTRIARRTWAIPQRIPLPLLRQEFEWVKEMGTSPARKRRRRSKEDDPSVVSPASPKRRG